MPHSLTLNDFIQCGVEDVLNQYRDNYDEIIRAHQLGEDYERYEEMENEVLNRGEESYGVFSECHWFSDVPLEAVLYFIDTICVMEELLEEDEVKEIMGRQRNVSDGLYAVIDTLAHLYCKRHFKKILAECVEDADVIDRMREIEKEEVEKQMGTHSKINDDVMGVIASFIA